MRCATWHWKDLVQNYNFIIWNFWIKIHMEIVWPHKIMRFITWEFMNCTWELQAFKPFWCNLNNQSKKFFNQSLKIHIEFTKLVGLLKTKDNKTFWNIKTRWIKCFFPTSHAMSKYKQLLLKMAQDFTLAKSIKNVVAKMNLNLILNVQLIMTLLCLLPLLEIVHVLIKFNQT